MAPTKPQDVHDRAIARFREQSAHRRESILRDSGFLGITPRVGDKIRVVGPFPTWHYGVVVGRRGSGEILVVHNDKDLRRVVETTLAEFAKNRPVEMVQRAKRGTEWQVAERAAELLGEPYDLWSFNCEHVANYAANGEAASPQVMSALLTLGIAAVGALLLRGGKSWDPATGRYRDARGRFAAG
jgi:hypothetical protein